MRRSQVFFQQHSGRMFRDLWKLRRNRDILDNGALKALESTGLPVVDANKFIRDEQFLYGIDPDKDPTKSITMDDCHPDYHEEVCLIYSDNNVLLGGLEQAKIITNSCEMPLSTLPASEHLNNLPADDFQDKLVNNCIRNSLLFDAVQEKLPKRKDPERPAFNFPRDYGISDKRKNFLLGKRLVQLCSSLNPQLLDKRRIISRPVSFQSTIFRDGKTILLNNLADVLITSSTGIEPIVDKSSLKDAEFPSIQPLSPYVSLESHHIYKFEDLFPLNDGTQVHTAIIHYNKCDVINLFETEVTESQLLARSLMKCYTFALAQAKHNFGKEIQDLPEPVVVQCIQMNSKAFHFCTLQLNTTAGPDETNTRNAFWSMPILYMFDTCDYVDAKPELIGYNPQVFHNFLTFYRNC